jgi:hypothetical protein
MKTHFHIATALILAGCAFSSQAAESDAPLTDCVSLGKQQQIVRAGGNSQFFLKDGENHYNVAFRRSCDSILRTSKLEISTAGEVDRLCPQGTQVKTDDGVCEVSQIQPIDAEEFARRKARASR